ncbi:MAG: hypothetical protein ACO331_07085, partial [Prochlorothrix sp.]
PRLWGCLWGISSALTVALRLQYLPTLALVGLWVLLRRRWGLLAWGSLGGGLMMLGVGWLDWVTWGAPFISYTQNYLFNKTHNVSALFGVDPWFYFLEGLLYASAGLWVLVLWRVRPVIHRGWPLLAMIAVVVLTHSAIPHKEYRFIFAVIPLWLILAAIVLDHDLPPAVRDCFPWRRRSASSLKAMTAFWGFVLVLTVGLGGILVPPAQGTYRGF